MKLITLSLLTLLSTTIAAQESMFSRLGKGMRLELESTTTVGGGDYAPLWLSGNRYGLSSVDTKWNYERVTFHRDMEQDSAHKWRMGYGADVAIMFGGERTICVQELFLELSWKKLYATVGSKRQPLSLDRNHKLTSGGLSYGINARPIPQLRIGAEYFTMPWTKGWWQVKGHLSYGFKTDGAWQKHFLDEYGHLNKPTIEGHRTEGTLYHEKAMYWKFGKPEQFPLDMEIGLQWATEFGGTAYSFIGRNATPATTANGIRLNSGFTAYKNALFASGNDVTDGNVANTEGNHLGSWIVGLTWHGKGWSVKAYGERFFEDISQLGLTYGISDHLIGIEAQLPQNPYVSNILIEHLNSREQSGAVYHDYSSNIPDKMNGRDNYYNHNIYTGWQNYGMVMGNPLITSPLYNSTFGHGGEISMFNNRTRAWHIGLSGNPFKDFSWRLLMTFSRNWGTYATPFTDPSSQTYMMIEAAYAPHVLKGWSGKITVGLDRGKMLGNNTGCQLTVAKRFDFR